MAEIKKDNKVNKYNNGRIYKIIDNNYTECYIGSTIERLCTRMSKHRFEYLQYKEGNKKKGKTTSHNLFDKYGLENCKIELIENYPCNSKEELLKREGYHQKNTPCINRCIAGRTEKEWALDNKESLSKYKKQWYQDNKEKMNECFKKYKENNKDKIKERKHQYYLKRKQAKHNEN